MHSFLIASRNKDFALKKANKICDERKVKKLDISILQSDKQIGIPDIKGIQANVFLKPIKSKEKALIISAYYGLTIEAQNALLKLLEEPPANTIIILLIESLNIVLPTIKSRCKIIELNEEIDRDANEKELDKFLKLLDDLEKQGIGERLKIAEGFSKNKEEAIQTIEKIILAARKEVLKNNDEILLKKINKLQKTYTIIKNTNVNLRLALENLFLNI